MRKVSKQGTVVVAAILIVSSMFFAYTQLSSNRPQLQASAQDTPNPLRLFLKITNPTMDGESGVPGHENEIELESYEWSESKGGLSTSTRGSTAVKVDMKDFIFVMRYSRASPLLFVACASGQVIGSMVLTVRKIVGTETRDFMTWTFTDVLVTSYSTVGEAPMEFPKDHVTIAFSTIKVRYQQIMEDGSLGPPITKGWDLRTNQQLP